MSDFEEPFFPEDPNYHRRGIWWIVLAALAFWGVFLWIISHAAS